jgi:hypothetical protein
MIVLATSVVLTWLAQFELSNKDQWTVTLLQRINSNQHLTTFLCKGFIVVSEDCTLLVIILKVLIFLNIIETKHCTFFRESLLIFELSFITVDTQ